ncbi:MAG: Histidine kinase, region:Bacterial chemotaxis sensory transducer [Proteobacteria bacterium]|nr:Histidine kinase, region:Bacterial chemotaxis sensory transducer [Pseudomonadota bacterium]
MFSNLKIGMRLGLGFAITILFLLAIAIMGIVRVSGIGGELDQLLHTQLPKMAVVNDLVDSANRADIALKGATIYGILKQDTQAQKQIEQMQLARKKAKESIEALDKTLVTPKGKELLAKLKGALTKYAEVNSKALELLNARKFEEAALTLMNGNSEQRELVAISDEMLNFIGTVVEEQGKVSQDMVISTKTLLIVLAIAAVLLSIAFAYFVTRSITRPLMETVACANSMAEGDLTMKVEVDSKDEVGQLKQAVKNMIGKLAQIMGEVTTTADALNSAAGQVSATAQSLSQASSEQAASVEETTASIEQMTASITQNTENAKVTDNMATKSAVEATEGGAAVKKTAEAMKQIAGKIGIIDDIAYQTNLLALNAAIEAARAGEHGKGFAVVAAEVRKLAERSLVAAQEIGELAGSSVMMAENAGKLLDEMVPSIKKTSDLVQEIAAASQEQSVGVGQINGAMGQLNKATQQNASASEELAATSEEMGGQASQLQTLMEFFKIDGSGAKAAVRTAVRATTASAKRGGNQASGKLALAAAGEHDFERF